MDTWKPDSSWTAQGCSRWISDLETSHSNIKHHSDIKQRAWTWLVSFDHQQVLVSDNSRWPSSTKYHPAEFRPRRSPAPHREEVAEGDVWENLVGSVLPALALALHPEVLQAAVQAARGAQVKGVFLRDWVIQGGVVAVGMQPEIKSIPLRVSACTTGSCFLCLKASIAEIRKRKYNFIFFLQMKSWNKSSFFSLKH